MATRPKAVIESRNGEKFSPITITKNVLTDDGRNLHDILSDRKEDMMTPTIENSSSMFKVGQGDNVDYSSNVVNGAYESMILKGKTMVNYIQEPSSQDIVLPYEFEDGQYVTINDTKESGALGVELKGQTLVNLVVGGNEQKQVGRANNTLAKYNFIYKLDHTKTYTLCFEVSGFNGTNYFNISVSGGNNGGAGTINQDGKYKIKISPDSSNSGKMNGLWFYWETPRWADGNRAFVQNIVLLEGDYTNIDLPYFTGMTSCKMPTLHTAGSLFDAQKIIPNNAFTYSHSTNIGRFEFTNRGDVVANTSIQLPAGTYDISFLIRGVCDNGRVAITFAKDGQAWHACSRVEINYGEFGSTTFKEVKFQRTFDAPVTVTLVGHGWAGGATGSGWCEFKDIRFTPVGKTSILSLPEEVVLRSLPNGVCDTFNTRTGVYTQRIGEWVLNGSSNETWRVSTDNYHSENISSFYVYPNVGMASVGSHYLQCSLLPVVMSNPSNYPTYEYVYLLNTNTSQTVIGISKTKLATQDTTGLRTYLQANPLTIQYELATPIVTKINLSSTLKSWNTTTHIYSEIPENTLYPTLTHSNPTYPAILKPSTKYSIVANSYSNSHTNSAINFNLGGATASTTVGSRVTTITTPSTLSNELLTMSGRGNKLSNVMVIEGDVVGDEPYFEGICDCKSPILLNVGKNLFNINNHTENQWSFSSGYPYEQNTSYGDRLRILGDEIHFSTDGGTVNKGVGYYIPLCKNKDYTFRINKKDGNGNYCVKLFLIHSSEHPLKKSIQQHSKFGINNETISSSLEANFNSANYDMCAIYIGGGWESGTQTTRSYVFNNISLTESNQQVEPYKSNTTTFNQKGGKTIVLRSLPSGVCDTLNVETGEYVQRIGEVVLDGSGDEQWSALTPVYFDNLLRWKIGLPRKSTVSVYRETSMVCDRVKVVNYAFFADRNYEFVSIHENGVDLQLMLEKSKAATVAELKEYLQQHHTIVQYELATPIVSTIDVQGFPYAYTNGHVQLSSGSIEQLLTPKVEYSVVTNRNGQIRSNQKMVERHQKQLDRLQAMILANLVNTQYEQTLTNLKYDLKNVREEVK